MSTYCQTVSYTKSSARSRVSYHPARQHDCAIVVGMRPGVTIKAGGLVLEENKTRSGVHMTPQKG